MKISGFTFLRNAEKLYYPYVESIQSILDLVDEFVVVLGQGDPDDLTGYRLAQITSPKLKIYHSLWDLEKYPNGAEYGHQTDLAKEKCSGDWLFYLQGDELIHEKDHPLIRQACSTYLDNTRVEGFVLEYLHFFGDYDHYFKDHCWYKREIRVIRNLPDIHSWKDAQSFRIIPDFKGNDYFRIKNTRKLNCIALPVDVYHYGWVRPPGMIVKKNEVVLHNYTVPIFQTYHSLFDYGRIDRCLIFQGDHPSRMAEWILKHDWKNLLRYSGPAALNRSLMKHEKLKYRVLRFIEENLLFGYVLGGFNNFKQIGKFNPRH
ncbi:MAG: hypothetical protein SH818_14065 [Saprospiraceae bacterium]|nr:hypothetical protein [Saprospiraceae bacterium]